MTEDSNSSILSYAVPLGCVALGWVLGLTSGWFKKSNVPFAWPVD